VFQDSRLIISCCKSLALAAATDFNQVVCTLRCNRTIAFGYTGHLWRAKTIFRKRSRNIYVGLAGQGWPITGRCSQKLFIMHLLITFHHRSTQARNQGTQGSSPVLQNFSPLAKSVG